MKTQYATRFFRCVGCSADFAGRARTNQSFCSLLCYRSSARPGRKTGETVPCKRCGTAVYRAASAVKPAVFCGVPCHVAYQSRHKTEHVCKTCGAPFKWSPSRTKNQNPTYCSLPCRTACPDWHAAAVVAGNLKQQNAKAPNRLEVAGYALLDGLNLPHRRQALIAEKFVVDAVLDHHRIVVQWDGDYWHGFRASDDQRPLQSRQQRRSTLDKSQDAYMRACGYRVLRFWEHEVFKQQEKVCAAIQSAIRQPAA